MLDPVYEHKAIIEEFVRRTPAISSRLVRQEGIYSKAIHKKHLNALVEKLNPEDRELLAQMLEDERIGALHDSLVILNEACLEGLKLIKEGEEIPSEPYGYTMFHEYMIVLEDEDWSSIEG
jgi:hypothetical protein